jgi:hypothetical protein
VKNRRNHAQKNRTISGSLFANFTSRSFFAPFACIESDAGYEERIFAERSDSHSSLIVELFDLAEPSFSERLTSALGAVTPR